MVSGSRAEWIERLFPAGIPRLWCPPLTPFNAEGQLARERFAVHLRHIGRYTQGWLIPGSTGEGWQMNDDDVRDVLSVALDVARQVDARVMVGILRPDTGSAIECIRGTMNWLCHRAGTDEPDQALVAQHVCGFMACPPTGHDKTDDEIRSALQSILRLNLPAALYQLPQVTQNEISPKVAEELAAAHANFILFKDTSGTDRVALSKAALPGVFQVRGADCEYTRWLKSAGGQYDGFLLSTANVFADRYAAMIDALECGDPDRAQEIISPVEDVVDNVFAHVKNLPWGNAFTNANKAMDHFMALGPSASLDEGPYLYGRQQLPRAILESTRRVMRDAGVLPEMGYLAEA